MTEAREQWLSTTRGPEVCAAILEAVSSPTSHEQSRAAAALTIWPLVGTHAQFTALVLERGPDSHQPWGDDAEGMCHLVAVLFNRQRDGMRFVRRREAWQSHEQDAERQVAHAKRELAEILVCGEQDALLAVCELKNRIVGDSRREFGDGENVVPVQAQARDDRGIDAFVGEQLHATDLETG